MKLHWSPRSPFVRKVMITLHETGLVDRVERVRSVAAINLPPNPDILADNPLGKIPVLVLESGQSIFDSRVICEYLDTLSGKGLFPADPDIRLKQLCWQALADGVTDILLLWRTELTRSTGPWTAVTDGWQVKVRASLQRLESEVETIENTPFGIGHIALICMLGQLDFRWPDCGWRTHFPKLAALEAALADRASVKANPVINDDSNDDPPLTRGHLTFSG